MNFVVKIVLWAMGIAILLLFATYFSLPLIMAETQSPTAISYYFSIEKSDSKRFLDSLRLLETNNFTSQGESWQLNSFSTGWVEKKTGMRITVDLIEINEKTKISVSIIEKDPRKNKLWPVRVKSIESALLNFSKSIKVILHLDPNIYGKCSSPERPTKVDSFCAFEFSAPIDMEKIESAILKPREK